MTANSLRRPSTISRLYGHRLVYPHHHPAALQRREHDGRGDLPTMTATKVASPIIQHPERGSSSDITALHDVSFDGSQRTRRDGPSGPASPALLPSTAWKSSTRAPSLSRGAFYQRPENDINKIIGGITGMVFPTSLFPHKTVLQNLTMAPAEAPPLPNAKPRTRAPAARKWGCRKGQRLPSFPAASNGASPLPAPLAMQPNIMLFDEPTSALDHK